MTRALTPKQEAFAVAVAQGKPYAEAYRASYDVSKMRPATIQKEANRLKNRPLVARRIAELAAPAIERAQDTVDAELPKLLLENARIGFSDVRRLLADDGTIKPPAEWDADMAAAVSSIKVRELFGEGKDGKGVIGQTIEVKLWDKGTALDRLGRHLGMYEKDNTRNAANLFEGLPRKQVKAIRDALSRERTRAVLADAAATPPGVVAGED